MCSPTEMDKLYVDRNGGVDLFPAIQFDGLCYRFMTTCTQK